MKIGDNGLSVKIILYKSKTRKSFLPEIWPNVTFDSNPYSLRCIARIVSEDGNRIPTGKLTDAKIEFTDMEKTIEILNEKNEFFIFEGIKCIGKGFKKNNID